MIQPHLASALRRGIKQTRRQIVTQSLATTAMAAALGLAALAWGVYGQLDVLAASLEDQVRLLVFLEADSPAARDALAQKIAAWPEVVGVRTVSTEEALSRLKALLGEQKGLWEGLGPEVMPPLFELHLTPQSLAPLKLSELTQRLKKLQGVAETSSPRAWVERIRSLVSLLRKAGLTAALIMSLAGVFIVFATIRLSLAAAREEVQILRLIGAAPWFIRGPFLIQGAGQGIIAALAALAALLVFEGALSLSLPTGYFQLRLVGWLGGCGLVLAGLLAGLTGAWLALRRLEAD